MFQLFTLFVKFVVTSVLVDLLTPKQKIQGAKPLTLGEIDVPTVEENRSIPVVIGRSTVSPNLVWHGDFEAEEVRKKVKTGLISSQRVTIGVRYKLGMWLQLTEEVCDKLIAVYVEGNKKAYNTPIELSKTLQPTIIRAKTRIGAAGTEVPDGIDAQIGIYSSPNHTLDSYLERRLGQGNIPGYKGKTHAVWYGPSLGREEEEMPPEPIDPSLPLEEKIRRAYQNNLKNLGIFVKRPGGGGFFGTGGRVPAISFLLERMPSEATIFSSASGVPFDGVHPAFPFIQVFRDTVRVGEKGDANPAWAIVELLRNRKWGAGIAGAYLDYQSFAEAAQVLFEEGNGVSLTLDTSRPIREITDVILKQVNGVFRIDPVNGRIGMRLVRSSDMPVESLNDSNIEEVINFQKASQTDLVSEVRLAFADRDFDYASRVAIAQNSAVIAGNGRIVSAEVSFETCVNSELATVLAQRELQALSTPLTTATLRIKTPQIIQPGDVLLLNSNIVGVSNLRVRVSTIKYNNAMTSAEVEVVQDLFSNGAAVFKTIVNPVVQQPIEDPMPIENAAFELAPYELTGSNTQSLLFYAEFNDHPGTPEYQVLTVEPGDLEPTDFDRNFTASPTGILAADLSAYDHISPLVFTASMNAIEQLKENFTGKSIAILNGEFFQILGITYQPEGFTLTSYKRAIFDSLPVPHAMGSKLAVLLDYAIEPDPLTQTIQADTNPAETVLSVSGIEDIRYYPLGASGFAFSDGADAPEFRFQIANVSRFRSPYPNPLGVLKLNNEMGVLTTAETPAVVVGPLTATFTFRNKLSLAAVGHYEFFSNQEPGTDAEIRLFAETSPGIFELIDTQISSSLSVTFEDPMLEPGTLIRIDARARKATPGGNFIYSKPQTYFFQYDLRVQPS